MDTVKNVHQSPPCAWCSEKSTLSCGSCGDVWYCSKEHKRLHWIDHFDDCKPYKVLNSSDKGQYVMASRFMKAGTLIIREEPIVVGPLGTSDLICLVCYAPIYEENFFKCPDCLWPMCSMKCAAADAHELECDILSRDEKHCGVPNTQGETPRYDLILILRSILLKNNNPKMWNVIQNMTSHGSKLKEKRDPYQIAAVRYFKEVCKLDLSEDEIHRVRGAMLANVFEIRSDKGTRLRGLYSNTRLMNHSCVPNIHLSSTTELVMEARTAINIEKGDELNVCYTGTDSPIWERQACLSENHYFNCSCRRCSDPFELGTMFSSPRCPICPQLIMKQIVHEGKITWTCPKCKSETGVEEIIQEIEDWTFRLEMNELFGSGTPYKITQALAIIEQHFHKKHFLWLRAGRKALRKLKDDNSFSAIKLKRYIWEKTLEIYDIIEPGITRRRGMIIAQLANTILTLADENFIKEEETSKQQAEGFLLEAKLLSEEAYKILRLEPKGTTENNLASSLMQKISNIINKLKNENETDFKNESEKPDINGCK